MTSPLRSNPRFRRLAGQLHELGPRPVGELIAELAVEYDIPANEVLAHLEKYARLSPAIVQAFGGDEWTSTILSIEGSGE